MSEREYLIAKADRERNNGAAAIAGGLAGYGGATVVNAESMHRKVKRIHPEIGRKPVYRAVVDPSRWTSLSSGTKRMLLPAAATSIAAAAAMNHVQGKKKVTE